MSVPPSQGPTRSLCVIRVAGHLTEIRQINVRNSALNRESPGPARSLHVIRAAGHLTKFRQINVRNLALNGKSQAGDGQRVQNLASHQHLQCALEFLTGGREPSARELQGHPHRVMFCRKQRLMAAHEPDR